MKDKDKNSQQLMSEIDGLGREITRLRKVEAKHKELSIALRESEQGFRSIFDNANDGIVLVDFETLKFFNANNMFCQMLGYSLEEIKNLSISDIHSKEDMPYVMEQLQKQLTNEIDIARDIPMRRKDGSIFYADISKSITTLSGKTYLTGIFRDITEGKKIDLAIRNLVKKASSSLGKKFFQSMARYLAEVLNADYAFVGEFFKDPDESIRTIAVYGQGKIIDNFEYELKDTPCEKIIKQKACTYPADVARDFPNDFLLKEMKIEAYTGIPLFGSAGEVLGIIAALFHKPIESVRFCESVLQLFASRIASEIERQKSDESLAQELSFRKAVIESTTEGLCVCHAISQSPSVRFTVWNSRMTEITGYTMDEINRLGWYQSVYPDLENQKKAQERMERMRQGDDIINEEWEITRSDREKRLVNISTRILKTDDTEHILALMQDITESRQRDKEIEKIFNMTGYMVCIASMDAYFLRINQSFVDTLGYSMEELLSRPFIDFIHPEDKQKTAGIIKEKLEQGAKVIGFENRYICKDGKYKWLSWTSHPVVEENLMYAIAYDITERKIMEQEQKKHLEFENLLRNISARFIDIPSSSVDDEITQAIKMMVLFFDVDRGSFIRILSENNSFKVTHLWAREDEKRLSELINTGFLKKLSWLTDRISKGEVFSFSDPEKIPRQALSEKKFFIKQGVKSQITIPLKVGGEVLGALAFVSLRASRKWSEKDIQRLRLAGEMFVNVLKRVEATKGLKSSKLEIEEQKKILEEKNIALRVVIEQVETEKKKLADDIITNIDVLLVPIIKKLRIKGVSRKYANLLEHHLKEIALSFGRKISEDKGKLTPREIEICSMIRGGLTSKEIATLLSITYQTIGKHRKNIRQKLGISGKDINLTSFLQNI